MMKKRNPDNIGSLWHSGLLLLLLLLWLSAVAAAAEEGNKEATAAISIGVQESGQETVVLRNGEAVPLHLAADFHILCSAGNSNATLTFNGVALESSPRVSAKELRHSQEISSARGGELECWASSEGGKFVSYAFAFVDVDGDERSHTWTPSPPPTVNLSVAEETHNSSFVLRCSLLADVLPSGEDEFGFLWIKNGQNVSGLSAVNDVNDGSAVRIPSVDQGTYGCLVYDRHHKRAYAETTIMAPKINDLSVKISGSEFRFLCTIESGPPASVKWTLRRQERGLTAATAYEDVSVEVAGANREETTTNHS